MNAPSASILASGGTGDGGLEGVGAGPHAVATNATGGHSEEPSASAASKTEGVSHDSDSGSWL